MLNIYKFYINNKICYIYELNIINIVLYVYELYINNIMRNMNFQKLIYLKPFYHITNTFII